MKQFTWFVFITLMVACSETITTPDVLKFDLAEKTRYNFTLISVTAHESKTSSSTDSLLLDFSFQPMVKDTMGDRILMIIDRLHVGNSSNTQALKSAETRKWNEMMKTIRAQQDSLYNSIGKDSLFLVIGSDGALEMLDGFDSLVTRLATRMTMQERDVRMSIKGYLTSTALRDLLRDLFFYLPAGENRKGNSWVNNVVYTAKAPVKYSNLITIDSVGDDVIQLNASTQISAGTKDNYYMKGTRSAKVSADRRSGAPLSVVSDENSVVNTTDGEIRLTKKLRVTLTSQDF